MQFKRLHVLYPYILHLCETAQIIYQVKHFLVLWGLPVKRHYGNAIRQLVREGVDRVINQNHVFEGPIPYDPQIFHIVVLWREETVVTIESILDELVVGVQVVKNRICIGLMARCEDYYLKIFGGFL